MLLCTQFAWRITIDDVKITFIVVIDTGMIDLLMVRLVFRSIWSAEIERGEAIHYDIVCEVDEDSCELKNSGQMWWQMWWQYHLPVVLPRF